MKVQFLLLGQKDERRFDVYSNLLSEREISFLKIDFQDILEKGYESLPETEQKTIVRVFSPWYSKSIVESFAEGQEKNIKERFGLVRGDDFFSSTPQVTAGFKRFMEMLHSYVLRRVENPLYVNHPLEIAIGRDKREMMRRFQERKVPHPKTYLEIDSLDGLLNLFNSGLHNTLFLKIHSGSLGRGIAYYNSTGFYTTIGIDKGNFTSNGLRKIIDEDEIKRVTEFLFSMGSLVQEGINSATLGTDYFHFRAYGVHEEVLPLVLYVNNQLITNEFHGARVYQEDEILRFMPKERIDKIKETARKVGSAFESRELGSDIGFDTDFNPYCFETNFLSGPSDITFIYQAEIQKNEERLK